MSAQHVRDSLYFDADGHLRFARQHYMADGGFETEIWAYYDVATGKKLLDVYRSVDKPDVGLANVPWQAGNSSFSFEFRPRFDPKQPEATGFNAPAFCAN